LLEAELIENLKRRDETALIELVNTYKKKITSFCYHYTLNYHDAEDVSQEVFLSFYKSIGSFRAECSLSTYLYRIAISKCLDYKRKKNIGQFLKGLFRYHQEADYDWEETNEVRQCVLALPEKLKVPVILFYYTGLTQAEIANVLSISPKSVEGRIYRAKQKLKVQLQERGCIE